MNSHDGERLFSVKGKGEKKKVEILKRRMLMAQRIGAPDTNVLINKVLKQVSHHGIDYVLSNVSPESREIYMRARSVWRTSAKKVAPMRDDLWEVYYDSCFIEARKNRRLAMQRLPKKMWKNMDGREREKMKRGIQKQKLDDWV